MKKQILILEDLGVNRKDFVKLFRAAKLPFDLIWEEEAKDRANIAGLIMVKKTLDEVELSKYPNLKFIAVAFTGYDSVDLMACRKRKIAVYNVPAYATNSVAELVIALAISLLRQIPVAHNTMCSGGWDFAPGQDLSGKTIGIIGTGEIGLRVAELFKAFGCRVIGWSRREKKDFKKLGGRYVKNLKELLAESDIVSLHLPLNKETAGFFGTKEFKAMKKTAWLINTARGGIVDQADLVNALKIKTIAGAALDVFVEEPLPRNHALRKLPNVILTPHIAFKTKEALIRRSEITIKNIKNFLNKIKENRVA